MHLNLGIRLAVVVAFAAGLLVAQPSNLVISQVYGGGGNSGATLRNDFIEIFNPTASSVSVTGWSVQYASSTGSSWAVTNLSGTIGAGQYYLVQEAQGSGGTVNLPTPDATGTITMSATTGKVALVNSTTALSGTCPSGVVDFVGYGSANCSETSPTNALSSTTAALRNNGGCTDTGNNSADFTIGTPSPRNSASPTNSCGSSQLSISTSSLPAAVPGTPYSTTLAATGGTPPYTAWTILNPGNQSFLTINSSGVLQGNVPASQAPISGLQIQVTDSASGTASRTFTIAINSGSCSATHTIEDIQGSGDISPLVSGPGASSTNNVTFSGLATAVAYNGLFVQQTSFATSDDPARSNGIFVYTNDTPSSTLRGHNVCVTGKVLEYTAGDSSGVAVTEISLPNTVTDLGTTGTLPTPVTLTASLPDATGAFNQLEKYEWMRVQVSPLTAVSGTLNSFGHIFTTITGLARPFREPGIEAPESLLGSSAPAWNGNPERIKLNLTGQDGVSTANLTVGQTLSGIVGPLHYEDRTYTIYPDAGYTTGGTPLTVQPVPAPLSTDLTIANFNTEHFYDKTSPNTLSDTAYATKIAKLSKVIREVLNSPDVVVLEEVENIDVLQGNGPLIGLVQKIVTDGGPTYVPYLQEGNDIGGIDIAFLVKTSKVTVLSVTQENKTETWNDPTGGPGSLLNDRPPLVLKATATRPGGGPAFPFTVIGVHQKSLIDIDGAGNPGARNREKRATQAESLANLIKTKYLNDNLFVAGDFNAFELNDGYVDVIGGTRGAPAPATQTVRDILDLYDPDLINLGETFLPPAERYSYSFRGNAQMIDHILANQKVLPSVRQFVVGHPNSVFPDSLRSDANRAERVSDHDAPIAYINLPANPTTAALTVNTVPAGLTVLVDGNPYVAPFTLQFAVSTVHTIAVNSPQTIGGKTWTFQSWSDSGAQSHQITLSGASTYTATFTTQEPPTGTFGVSGAVTSRTNGSGANERVYTVRLTNNGTLAATDCVVTGISFPAPAGNMITLGSTLPLSFGAIAASGGTSSAPVLATVPTTNPAFQMRLAGSCVAGGTTRTFSTAITTFR